MKSVAEPLQVAPEELVRTIIEEFPARPEEEFREALERVVRKNAELYRRPA